MAKARARGSIHVGGRTLQVANLAKRMYPSGFTKADVIDYYIRIAPLLLPHFRDRPVALKRFPNGVRGESYWDKDAPSFAPDWIQTAPVWRASGESQIHYVVIANVETLVWAASIAALELHPFLHRAADVDRPTSVIFDLDPGPGVDILDCADVAYFIRERLDAFGLTSFPKVSGSKGLQLYVPLNTPVTYEATQPFARTLAQELALAHPSLVVAEMAKSLRTGKVFIDWSQNATHKTTVGVYSLRAKHDRPFVSLPVTWRELEQASKKRDADTLFWDPAAALARTDTLGDVFESVLTLKQKLPPEFRGGPTRTVPARTAKPSVETLPWKSSRQGGRRRFVITRGGKGRLARTGGKGGTDWVVLWLEGPKGSEAIERARERALDYGTYEVVEGRIEDGQMVFALDGHVFEGVWTLSRGIDGRWTFSPATERKTREAVAERLPSFVPPMLAEARTTPPRGDEWLYEAKLDGYRVEAAKAGSVVRLYSRRGNDLTKEYPQIAKAVAGIDATSALVDGEIVAIDDDGRPSFQALHHFDRARPVVYYAFDLLERDGRDLRDLPLDARKARLAEVLDGSDVLLSETLDGDVDRIVEAIKHLNLEGVIAKRRRSRYSSRRTADWIKVKFLNRQEFVIGGYKPAPVNFDSLIVGYYEDGKLWFAGKVRNGYTPTLRAALWRSIKPLESTTCPFADSPTRAQSHWGEGLTTDDMRTLRWLKPELVAEVGFVEWTRDKHLRHSTFLGLRSDKRARDVVREMPAAG